MEDSTNLARTAWAGWLHLDTAIEPVDDLREIGAEVMEHAFKSSEAAAAFELIAARHPNLLPASASQVTISEGALDTLLDEVGRLVPVEGRFALQRRLLEVIDAGNRTGRFGIPIRRIPIPPIPEPPSPFKHEAFERTVSIRTAIDRFTACLGYEAALAGRETWGRIFLSAMCFGGLLRAEWLLAIEASLSSDPDQQLRWLDLSIALPPTQRPLMLNHGATAAREDTPIRFRRWFPDPLTRLLLRHWSAHGRLAMPQSGRTLATRVMRLIRAYAKAQAFDRHLPSTLGKLAEALETRLHLHIPPFLVAYATDRLPSASLPPQAWQRLVVPPVGLRLEVLGSTHSDAPTPVATNEDDSESSLTEDEALRSTDADDAQKLPPKADDLFRRSEEELWPDQLKTLATLVLRSPPKEIEQRVRHWKFSIQGSLIPSIACLADWVTDWLLQDHKWQRKLRPRTIYQKLNCAGARIVARLGARDPAALGDEDDYIEMVEGVLEDIDNNSVRRRAASALRSFCTYLAKEKRVAAMSDPSIFNMASAKGLSVDANLISVGTFYLALRSLTDGSLPDHSSDPRLNDALCQIATLGFFAGLRRSEAIGLRLSDLEITSKDVYLYVRPNNLRDLKSSNAFRRLPLHRLLPAVRLDELRKWARSEKASAKNPDAPLFPMFAGDFRVLDTSPKLRLITDAIQAAAGDSTLRFHHLRHSFATWMVVKFWLADQRLRLPPIPADLRQAIESGAIERAGRGQRDAWRSALPPWFLHTEHDHARWREALEERHELLGLAPTNRRALNQVSQLLGHGSSDITIASYVHLLDLLFGCTIRRLAPRFSTAQLSALSGLGADSVKRIKSCHRNARSDDGAARLLDAVNAGPLAPNSRRRSTQPQGEVDFLSPSTLVPPEDTYLRLLHGASALALVTAGRESVVAVAARYGISATKLNKAIERLRELPTGFAEYAAGLRNWRPPPPGTRASISVPKRPAEMELGKLTLAVIDKQLANPGFTKPQARTARDRFVKLLNGIVKAWLPGTHLDMHFGAVIPARRWLQFLDNLGLTSGVAIYHLPSTGRHASLPATQAAFWQENLDWASLPKHYSGPTLQSTRLTRKGEYAQAAGSVLIRIELDRMRNGQFLGHSKLPVLSAIRLVLAMCYVFPHQLAVA